MAELWSRVDAALSEISFPAVPTPAWESYRAEFDEGVPLLPSASAPVELAPADTLIAALLGKLGSNPLPGPLGGEVASLSAEFRRDPELSRRSLAWLLGDEEWEPASPGLVRFLGWTVLARYLAPV